MREPQILGNSLAKHRCQTSKKKQSQIRPKALESILRMHHRVFLNFNFITLNKFTTFIRKLRRKLDENSFTKKVIRTRIKQIQKIQKSTIIFIIN